MAGLDALRGLAALYVVAFHCWLLSFPGFPSSRSPAWLGWLPYGHLAVIFFLTLSGFSLALAPARDGWRLGGVRGYARRRAWRILPPYWAALLFSLLIAGTVIAQPHSVPPTGGSVAVYGLLLQDLVVAPTPNGAFWSIAVEAELYVLFPLLLVLRRRLGPLPVLALVVTPVLVLGLVDPGVSPVDKTSGLTAQLSPLFALGVVAAGAAAAGRHARRPPWHRLALLCAIPVIGVMLVRGPVWTVDHYFWIDLAVGPAMAMLLAGIATGRPAVLVRTLATGPLRGLGTFSYSLYLIHLPIVTVVSRLVAAPHARPGLPAFAVTLAVALPASLVAARLFAALFEIPFTRYRSWPALAAAARTRWSRVHGATGPEQDLVRTGHGR